MSKIEEIKERLKAGLESQDNWPNKRVEGKFLILREQSYEESLGGGIEGYWANRAFINNSPSDIQYLLDEVERLKEDNRQLTNEVSDLTGFITLTKDRTAKILGILEAIPS